jgi:peptide subunit release factor 1 (eRF1)
MEATMFSEKDLQTLLDHSVETRALSIYLNTDPSEINTEAAKLRLRNLLKTVDLPMDVQAVENFVNLEYDWAAKGLVVFSEQGAGFFESYPINLPIPDKVHVGEHLIIRPLVRLLNSFAGWCVVLVDKQGAKLFSFDLGEIERVKEISGDDVKQTKRGGGNAMHGRMGGADASSNVENIIDQNIKDVIDAAIDFFTRHHIRRIMIGGTEDNIARFKDELPKSWQSLVVCEFAMSMTASETDVLDRAVEEAFTVEKKTNRSLVEQAVTLAAKGSNGVIGLIDTLNAIHEGRVKTLLVSQDFEQEGYRCNHCGYLTTQVLDKCPFCSNSFKKIESAVEMAVQETLRNNAEVRVVADLRELENAGHIAAILRY